MGKSKNTQFKNVSIVYKQIGSHNQFWSWNLMDIEGTKPVSSMGFCGNGVENNKRLAKKAAEHNARLADAEIERKK